MTNRRSFIALLGGAASAMRGVSRGATEYRRARLYRPGGLVHCEFVATGCITLFTTYSPI
jgi:hypothetical protein